MHHTSVKPGEIAEHGHQLQGLRNRTKFRHHGEAIEQCEQVSIADERRKQLIRMVHAQSITKRYKMGKEIRVVLPSSGFEAPRPSELSPSPLVAWLQSSRDRRDASRRAAYGEQVGDPHAPDTVFSGGVSAHVAAQATHATPITPASREVTRNVTRIAAQAAQFHKPEGD